MVSVDVVDGDVVVGVELCVSDYNYMNENMDNF
jgi:hypothetical protein